MPLPTNQELNDGIEGRNPTPEQAQRIADLRNLILQASIGVRDLVGDGPLGLRALTTLRTVFIHARASVVNEPEAP